MVNGNVVDKKEDLVNGLIIGIEEVKVDGIVFKVSNFLGEFNFEEDEDEIFYLKDFLVFVCRCV